MELIEAILQQLLHGVAYDSVVAAAGRASKVIPDHEVKQWQHYPYQDAKLPSRCHNHSSTAVGLAVDMLRWVVSVFFPFSYSQAIDTSADTMFTDS